jgi:flagellar L-ring protein precursor FlgH
MRAPALLLLPALLLPALLGACGSLQRLSEIGRPPAMTASSDPTQEASYRPLTMPMPAAQKMEPHANALWRNGSRAFFKDQRAANVGDLITVLVQMTDSAALSNNTDAERTSSQTSGVPNMFGLEAALPHMLAGAAAASLLSSSGTTVNKGTGTMNRTEAVQLRLAGVVTQVLPNGNLAVVARQEVRVNGELRELQVSGVIRPQDIASDNTVLHDRMAEARISYGGRGQLTDVQSPRWGQQLMDILLPF